MVDKINANLAAEPWVGPADAGPGQVEGFKAWLGEQFGAAPKTKARAFERTLRVRRPGSSSGGSYGRH